MDIVLLDSITDATEDDHGKVGISGSHGGLYAAYRAAKSGLRAAAFNDAGRGLDDAGIAGVQALDSISMAGVAVSAGSAEIGSARQTNDFGVLSYVNETARALGLNEGDRLSETAGRLLAARRPFGTLADVEEARNERQLDNCVTVLCVDSAALINPQDKGRIIVTGSHGGLIGGDPARACKADARLVIFNDAGGGKNDIGFSRLPALDARGIAALTLDCHTCRIGDAQSALDHGVVSRANTVAMAIGFTPTKPLKEQLIGLVAEDS